MKSLIYINTINKQVKMIKKILIIFIIFLTYTVSAQVTCIPIFPGSNDNVTITFNAREGNQGLATETGAIYAHTGVITDVSTAFNDWRYVKFNWTVNDPSVRLTSLGNGLYSLNIPNIRSFYGVLAAERILKLAFIFRNAAGTSVGRAVGDADIFYDVYPDNYVSAQSLTYTYDANGNRIKQVNSSVPIKPTITQNGQTLTSSATTNNQWYKNGGLLSGATNQTYNPTISGYYSVRVTNSLGCNSSSDSIYYSVAILPSAKFTYQNVNCTSGQVQFTNNSINAATYLWRFGDGMTSPAPAPTYNYTIAGTYTVTLIAIKADGLKDSTTQTITVTNTAATAIITPGNAVSICQNDSVRLTASGGISYRWSTGQTTPTVLINQNGTFTVTVTNASNCTATTSNTVTVLALPVKPIISQNGQMFTSSALTGNQWYRNGSLLSGATTQTYIPSVTGYYSVRVTNNFGCSVFSDSIFYSIALQPFARFNYQNINCTNGQVQFTNTSLNTTTYLWRFGNDSTSTVANPSCKYTSAGTYTVTLIASTADGLKDSTSQTIIVINTTVAATIVQGSALTVCQKDSVQLTATGGISYLWSLGQTTPSIFASQTGVFSVTVTNTNGCTGIARSIVTVVATPKADFGYNILGGRASFGNLSSGASTYLWRFGNDSTSTAPNPITNYRANGLYQVCLVALNSSNCRDSICKTINITHVSNQELPEGLNIQISPNPTSGVLEVKLSFNKAFNTSDKLIITDMLGRQLVEIKQIKELNNFDISHLANGTYLLRLVLYDKIYTLDKVVKTN